MQPVKYPCLPLCSQHNLFFFFNFPREGGGTNPSSKASLVQSGHDSPRAVTQDGLIRLREGFMFHSWKKSIFLSHLLYVSKKAFHPDCHSSYPCGSCDQAATLLRLKSMLWPAVERLKDLGPLTLCTWLNEPILKPPLPGTSFMCKKRFHFHLLLLVQCDLKKHFM